EPSAAKAAGLDFLKPKGLESFSGVCAACVWRGIVRGAAWRDAAGGKALRGFGGASVQELIAHDGEGTFRTVYTVRFSTAVYVLHAFQKKSKRGIATPKHDIEVIRERLKI